MFFDDAVGAVLFDDGYVNAVAEAIRLEAGFVGGKGDFGGDHGDGCSVYYIENEYGEARDLHDGYE